MEFAKVNVEIRSQTGKGGARKVRAAGKVPGIVYGHKVQPVLVAFDEKTLVSSLDKERKRNTVFELAISGESQPVTVLIRDAQIDPLSRHLLHVDFQRISLEEEVHVQVPLVLTGIAKSAGVVAGGNMHQSVHSLPVAAKPDSIPAKIEIDVSGLNIGQAVHVSDLKLAAGVRVLLDPKEGLASVVAPKAEKIEEAAAPVEGAVPAEGAAAAEGGAAAAGAAPAAGAAAGGKAAPAAAKKEGEKKGK